MPDTPSAVGWVYLAGLVLLFLVCREIVCWYFKLNEITSLLRQVRDRLSSMQAYGIGEEAAAKAPPAVQERITSSLERGWSWIRGEWSSQRPVIIAVLVFVVFVVAVVIGFTAS